MPGGKQRLVFHFWGLRQAKAGGIAGRGDSLEVRSHVFSLFLGVSWWRPLAGAVLRVVGQHFFLLFFLLHP